VLPLDSILGSGDTRIMKRTTTNPDNEMTTTIPERLLEEAYWINALPTTAKRNAWIEWQAAVDKYEPLRLGKCSTRKYTPEQRAARIHLRQLMARYEATE